MFRRLPECGRAATVSPSTSTAKAVRRRAPATRVRGGAARRGGVDHCRTTPVSGAPRAPYCMMGVCFDCLVTSTASATARAAWCRVREGMRDRDTAGQAGARDMSATFRAFHDLEG